MRFFSFRFTICVWLLTPCFLLGGGSRKNKQSESESSSRCSELVETLNYDPDVHNEKLRSFLNNLFAVRPSIENWAKSFETIKERADAGDEVCSILAYTTILANKKNPEAANYLNNALAIFGQKCASASLDAKNIVILFERLKTKNAIEWFANQSTDPQLLRSASRMFGTFACKAGSLNIPEYNEEEQKRMIAKASKFLLHAGKVSPMSEDDRMFMQVLLDRRAILQGKYDDTFSTRLLKSYYCAKKGYKGLGKTNWFLAESATSYGGQECRDFFSDPSTSSLDYEEKFIDPSQKTLWVALKELKCGNKEKAYSLFERAQMCGTGECESSKELARWFACMMELDGEFWQCESEQEVLQAISGLGVKLWRHDNVALLRSITTPTIKQLIYDRACASNDTYRKSENYYRCTFNQSDDDLNLWYTAARLYSQDFDTAIEKKSYQMMVDAAAHGHMAARHFVALNDSQYISEQEQLSAITDFVMSEKEVDAQMKQDVLQKLTMLSAQGNIFAQLQMCIYYDQTKKINSWLLAKKLPRMVKLQRAIRMNDIWKKINEEKTYMVLQKHADEFPLAAILLAACDIEQSLTIDDTDEAQKGVTKGIEKILSFQSKDGLDASVLTYISGLYRHLGMRYINLKRFDASRSYFLKSTQMDHADDAYLYLAMVSFLSDPGKSESNRFQKAGIAHLQEGASRGGESCKIMLAHNYFKQGKCTQAFEELDKINNPEHDVVAIIKRFRDVFLAAYEQKNSVEQKELDALFDCANTLKEKENGTHQIILLEPLARLGMAKADCEIINLYRLGNGFVTDHQALKSITRVDEHLKKKNDDEVRECLGTIKARVQMSCYAKTPAMIEHRTQLIARELSAPIDADQMQDLAIMFNYLREVKNNAKKTRAQRN